MTMELPFVTLGVVTQACARLRLWCRPMSVSCVGARKDMIRFSFRASSCRVHGQWPTGTREDSHCSVLVCAWTRDGPFLARVVEGQFYAHRETGGKNATLLFRTWWGPIQVAAPVLRARERVCVGACLLCVRGGATTTRPRSPQHGTVRRRSDIVSAQRATEPQVLTNSISM